MEARATRLEDDMRQIRDLLTEIRIELARKPSTAALWGIVAMVLGVGLANSGLTFVIADWASRAG